MLFSFSNKNNIKYSIQGAKKVVHTLFILPTNIWIILNFINFYLFQLFTIYLNVGILGLAGMELTFLTTAHAVMCFALVVRMRLVMHQWFGCCINIP